MVRESKEEIGLVFDPKDLHFAGTMFGQFEDVAYTYYFFQADAGVNTPINCEPDKCDDMSWNFADKLPENVLSYIKHAIILNSTEKIPFYFEFSV